MADFVSQALITIDHAGGQVLLENVSDFSVEGPNGLTPVKTMNRANRVRGFRGGPSEVTASATVENEVDQELDLFALYKSRERFLLSFEEGPEDGARFQLVGCRIENLSRSYNADGESKLEVSFVAEELGKIPD